MAFHFPLQALLRFRESLERRERLRLQIVTRELSNAQQQWEEAKQARERSLQEFAEKLAEGLTASEMQFELACDRTRLRRIATWHDQVLRLEALRQHQIEAFEKAQQQRKIVENLRERQIAAYRLVQNRRAQQQIDERFLILHGGQASR